MIYFFLIILIILSVFVLLLAHKIYHLKIEKKKLQERFDNSQRLSGVGYFDGNFDDDKVWWSDELHKLIDLEPDQYITTKEEALNFIYETDREEYLIKLDESIKSGTPLIAEYRAKSNKTDVFIAEKDVNWNGIKIFKDSLLAVYNKKIFVNEMDTNFKYLLLEIYPEVSEYLSDDDELVIPHPQDCKEHCFF